MQVKTLRSFWRMSTECVFTPKEARNSALLFASIARSHNHRLSQCSKVLCVCIRISCCYGWCVLSELSATAELRGGMGLPLSQWSHACPCDAFRRLKRRGRRDAMERQSWSRFETFQLATKLRHVSTLIRKRMSSGLAVGHRPALLSAHFPLAPAWLAHWADHPTNQNRLSAWRGIAPFHNTVQFNPQNPCSCLATSSLTDKHYNSRFTPSKSCN